MMSFFEPLWNSGTGRKAFFFEKKKQKTLILSNGPKSFGLV